MLHSRIGGVDISFGLDWLAFSVDGINEVPKELWRVLPSCCEGSSKQHLKGWYGSGVMVSAYPKLGCHNYFMQVELRGEFFDSEWSVDDVLRVIYQAGGVIRPSRFDYRLDYYSDVSEFEPVVRAQNASSYTPWYPGKVWSGWTVGGGKKSSRFWRFYDWRRKHRQGDLQPRWRYEIEVKGDKARAWEFGQWWECDFDRTGPGYLADTGVVDAGFFSEVAGKYQKGELPQVVAVKRVSFDGSYLHLVRTMKKRVDGFFQKWGTRFSSKEELLSGLLIDVERGDVGYQVP